MSLYQNLIVFFPTPDLNEYNDHACHHAFDMTCVRCCVKLLTYMVLLNAPTLVGSVISPIVTVEVIAQEDCLRLHTVY